MQTIPEAERLRRLEIIQNQASTLPLSDELGRVDIGLKGAWDRAKGVVTADGTKVHDRAKTKAASPFFDQVMEQCD